MPIAYCQLYIANCLWDSRQCCVMKRLLKTLIPCLIFTCAGFYASAQAQPDYTVILKDSLQTTDTLQWLSNDVRIRQWSHYCFEHPRSSQPSTQMAGVVGKQDFNLSINPGETKLLPLNIIKQPQALAKWQPAELVVEDEHGTLSKKTFPFTYEPTRSAFGSWPPHLRRSLYSTIQNILSLKLLFAIMEISTKTSILLHAAIFLNWIRSSIKPLQQAKNIHSPIVYISAMHSANQWVRKMRAYLFVISCRNRRRFKFNVVNLSNDARQHTSKYPTIPMQLETGLMYFSKTFIGYVGFNGAIALKDSQQINFFYRTKQLVLAKYNWKECILYRIQQQELEVVCRAIEQHPIFFSFGQGISATYRGKNEHEVNVTWYPSLWKTILTKQTSLAVTMPRNKLSKIYFWKAVRKWMPIHRKRNTPHHHQWSRSYCKKDKLQLSFNRFISDKGIICIPLINPKQKNLQGVYGYSAMYAVRKYRVPVPIYFCR